MTAKVLWEPSSDIIERANITAYTRWLEEESELKPSDYSELWEWSVGNIGGFWESIWKYFKLKASAEYETPLASRAMPGARWFPGAKLNYASHFFSGRDPSRVAIMAKTEEGPIRQVTWEELRRKTSAFASSLKSLGVQEGDRVAAYLPNVPETIVSLLACASIGAVWSSCAPDFGGPSVVDRFKQIEPKVLLATHGYTYRGKWNGKAELVEQVRSAIPSIEQTIMIGEEREPVRKALAWDDLASPAEKQEFSDVPFDHPLWIVYSSGTTGLPKPIVHGHGGILLEHHKVLSFHNDLRPADRMFWYTSTGWMMWNYLIGSLMLDSTVVLYEGDPFFPDANTLWTLADSAGITFLGASAAFVNAQMKSGTDPRTTHSLKSLRGVGSTGSALSTDAFEWLYRHVKEDFWVSSISGGTDLATAFIGGCPVLPVRAGELQCVNLGADVAAFDEDGNPVIGEMGELVLRQPMPSMPVFLWGDATGERYRESYFSVFPGVWRHGDWIRIEQEGSCVIFGRSDATIKKMGVRMGTSEVYRVVDSIPQVTDSLVVDMEFLGGRSYMPLFVSLKQGLSLDDGLKAEIRRKIRVELSPKMVPDEIFQVNEVPRTLNGKKLEVPVRRIFLGADPSKVYNPGSLKNPDSMSFFIEFAKQVKK